MPGPYDHMSAFDIEENIAGGHIKDARPGRTLQEVFTEVLVDDMCAGLPMPKRYPPTPPVKPPSCEQRLIKVDPQVFETMFAVREGRMTFEQAFFYLMNELLTRVK